MEPNTTEGTRRAWEAPSATEVRVSAEVTAYAYIWKD